MRRAGKLLQRAVLNAPLALIVFVLGVGSATAAFSVFHSVFISALPYPNASRVVALSSVNRITGKADGVAPADFVEMRDNIDAFERIAGYIGFERSLHGVGEPEFVRGSAASWALFDILGEDALYGRVFAPQDDTANASPVVVLSHDLWSRKFGGRHSAIGESVRLGDKLYSIIGVMPAGFSFSGPVDFWTPLVSHSPRILRLRGFRPFGVLGLLKPGTDLMSAQAQLDVLSSRLAESYPASNEGWKLTTVSLRDSLVAGLRPYLWALLVASMILVVIACGNVATLFLARSAGRASEVAVRLSLGASQGRIFSRFLAEGLLFSLIGGFMGGTLAILILKAFGSILALQGATIPIRFSIVAWFFAFGLSVLSGVLFGIVPTTSFTPFDLARTLRCETPLSSMHCGRHWLRQGLVFLQIALTVTLCVSGTLLVLTFFRLTNVTLGFDPDHVMTVEFKLDKAQFQTPSAIADFQSRLLARSSSITGVANAGVTNFLPLEGSSLAMVTLPDSGPEKAQEIEMGYRLVDEGFFRTLRIPLVSGRQFSQVDSIEGPPVVIANEAASELLWGAHALPLGRSVELLGQEREVVGVVGSVRSAGLPHEPPPELYIPASQGAFRWFFLTIRHARGFDELARDIRAVVHSLNPDLAVGRIRTMASLVDRSVFDRRARAMVFGFYALLALLLTIAGLYGLVVTTTRQRTHELGVRMALGATESRVLSLVLRQVAPLILGGLLLGLGISAVSSQLLQSLLYGVSPLEPRVYVLLAVLMTFVALAACCIPVLRATRRDPMRALRFE